MKDEPLDLLRSIYSRLENGDQKTLSTAVATIKEQLAELADLQSTLARQPLPEAPASINVRVVDPSSQMEFQVTIREARAGIALIGRIPEISAALMGLGLVAMDTYIDSRRAERGERAEAKPSQGVASGPPMCPDGHGPMKASTKVDGEFYCSHAVGVHPQTQKKLYCMHKAKG